MSAIIAGLAAAIHLIVAYEVQPVLLLLAHRPYILVLSFAAAFLVRGTVDVARHIGREETD